MNAPMAALDYPWAHAPEPGDSRPVAPRLHWLRMPLPFRLDHINLWLLQGDDGWTAIDTGCDTPRNREAWEHYLANVMGGAPLTRLIATHGHVDHIGLAGWLSVRFSCPYHASFGEWIWSRLGHLRDVPEAEPALSAFLHRHGVPEGTAARMAKGRQGFMDLATDLPGVIAELRDGARTTFGGRDWQVIMTRGHTYEHAAFYCEADGILIAGDHLLPRISPVIAVFEMVPEADPLGDYLASFAQFAHIPDDVLVLPSHGLPYRGLHRRIAQLRAHHQDRLTETEGLLEQPLTAYALSRELFSHVRGDDEKAFALGETLAHVNHLCALGRVQRIAGTNGRALYSAVPG